MCGGEYKWHHAKCGGVTKIYTNGPFFFLFALLPLGILSLAFSWHLPHTCIPLPRNGIKLQLTVEFRLHFGRLKSSDLSKLYDHNFLNLCNPSVGFVVLFSFFHLYFLVNFLTLSLLICNYIFFKPQFCLWEFCVNSNFILAPNWCFLSPFNLFSRSHKLLCLTLLVVKWSREIGVPSSLQRISLSTTHLTYYFDSDWLRALYGSMWSCHDNPISAADIGLQLWIQSLPSF